MPTVAAHLDHWADLHATELVARGAPQSLYYLWALVDCAVGRSTTQTVAVSGVTAFLRVTLAVWHALARGGVDAPEVFKPALARFGSVATAFLLAHPSQLAEAVPDPADATWLAYASAPWPA